MDALISPTETRTSKKPSIQWYPATWDNYLSLRDTDCNEPYRLYFYQNTLLIEMGSEGINHSSISDLFTMLFFIWFSQKPGQIFSSLGRCLIEKPHVGSGAPDLVLYLGQNHPQWQVGEKRSINLQQWRVPDLVGEISDTTLSLDLDEKKHLYAALGIPEYWVIDVRGKRVFAFQLQENSNYKPCLNSQALTGLSLTLLEQALIRLETETNGSVAAWFLNEVTRDN